VAWKKRDVLVGRPLLGMWALGVLLMLAGPKHYRLGFRGESQAQMPMEKVPILAVMRKGLLNHA